MPIKTINGRKGIWLDSVIIIFSVFLLLLILTNFSNSAKAEDDRIFFFAESDLTREEGTHILFDREETIHFVYVFGRNCSSYNVSIETKLFAPDCFLHYKGNEYCNVGNKHTCMIYVNESAPFGDYNITIYFNYTTDNNEEVNNTFYYLIQYTKLLEIKNVQIPDSWDDEFIVNIELYHNLSKFESKFDSDGNIKVTNNGNTIPNPRPGVYSFKTGISKKKSYVFQGDEQELSYSITAYYNEGKSNRTVVLSDYNINFNPGPVEETKSVLMGNLGRFVAGTAIIAIVLFNYFHYFRKKRSNDKCNKRTSP